MIIIRNKNFGALGAVAKLWNKSGTLGKTAMVGTGLAAGGAAIGGGMYAKASKNALTGEMGKEFSEKVRQKIFFNLSDGSTISAEGLKSKQVQGENLKQTLGRLNGEASVNSAANSAAQSAARQSNISAASSMKAQGKTGAEIGKVLRGSENIAAKTAAGNTAAYKAGMNAGAARTGIMQGAKNTWGRMGTTGKAGAIAGGLAVGGMLAKGLFGGKKD